MIRVAALSMIVLFLAAYCARDWFKSLCALIVMGAILEHPDMPKMVMGIPGLNLWNLLFLAVCIGCANSWRAEGLKFDMPDTVRRLLIFYAVLILISTIRLIVDDSTLTSYLNSRGQIPASTFSYINELIFTTLKFAVPGLLIFAGCNSRSRLVWAASSTIAIYLILAVLTIKTVKLDVFTMTGQELQHRAHKVLPTNIGLHRVNLSMMFSGAVWAVFAFRQMFVQKTVRTALLLASGVTVLAMASTGGRTGYVTWILLGLILASLKWRKLLLGLPIILLIGVSFMPSVVDRMFAGFGAEDDGAAIQYTESAEVDLSEVTSGRVLAWPIVIDKILERPVVGYGREGMGNSGVTQELYLLYGLDLALSHPHNAYLQWLLDNGIIGLVVVVWFYTLIIVYSLRLLRDERRSEFVAVGGICFGLVGAALIASFGSQTFYPREGAIGMWCAIGLMLRIYVERAKQFET